MIFPDHQLLVAEEDRVIVGTVAVSVKRTHVGGDAVSLGYIFDVRTDPTYRRHGIGTALVQAVDDYLFDRGVDGVYGHIISTNQASLKLFAKMGYERVRQLMLIVYQPYPMFEFGEWMPRHLPEYTTDHDMVQAVHSSRDLYVPDVAQNVKDFGFERWTLDLGGPDFAGLSLFDQSYVFQQWPAHLPFPTEEEMKARGNKSLRLFDEVGIHNGDLLKNIFDNLRDLAVGSNVSKLTWIIDRMDLVPQFMFSEAYNQMDYWMVFKPLNPDWIPEWQDAPIYCDAREL
jgi:GNAT superfamily N-acetyltransferase